METQSFFQFLWTSGLTVDVGKQDSSSRYFFYKKRLKENQLKDVFSTFFRSSFVLTLRKHLLFHFINCEENTGGMRIESTLFFACCLHARCFLCLRYIFPPENTFRCIGSKCEKTGTYFWSASDGLLYLCSFLTHLMKAKMCFLKLVAVRQFSLSAFAPATRFLAVCCCCLIN